MYSIFEINNIISGKFLLKTDNTIIEHLATDSRKISFAKSTLFFAIDALRRDGHQYLTDAYNKGIRNFIVQKKVEPNLYKNANIILVKNSVTALQQIAIHHRNNFGFEIIGITGSNGKTIVKEWLYQLLQNDYNIVRNPKSYNSQIGVPLSIWVINNQNNLGIFEAGISTINEMQLLQKIIKPTIGILTNIGIAHNEGFKNELQKLKEKLTLFTQCKTLIYNTDNKLIANEMVEYKKIFLDIEYISWGYNKNNTVQVINLKSTAKNTIINLKYKSENYNFSIAFTDRAYIENTLHCICFLLLKKYSEKQINFKLKQLQPVALRLEQIKGINNCTIINDSYSNDLNSLQIALDYLGQQNSKQKHTVVLTDLQQSGINETILYKSVAQLLETKKINKLIGIGDSITCKAKLFDTINEKIFFTNTTDAQKYFNQKNFNNEIVLFKGARSFLLENLVNLLVEKVHQTILEISIEKLINNIKIHQQLIEPSTQIMAIVKAFGYGNGAIEIANVLQNLNVNYLAVAYADEGVELRKAGIFLPIMVMNTDESAFNTLIEYDLEPEIYSTNILKSFIQFAKKNALTNFPIHIKLDTGMNRLGFEQNDIATLCNILKQNNVVHVQSIFSHLVGSDDSKLKSFTKKQNTMFCKLATTIENAIGYKTILHIANSAAISNYPNLQHQMVRLGIGMYGVTPNSLGLQHVCTLKTTIAQIKNVTKSETIGYDRNGKLKRDSKIATVRIGYADGYNRLLGNGKGKMLVNGKLAPTIGNICMDMTMIDITDIENVHEEDYVTVFGEDLPVQEIANWCNTISYEILTGISQRVKRIYYD